MKSLPGLTPSCWSTIPTTQAPQPLEKPLHMVEATGIVRLWLQIQLPLWKQCCSQTPLQLLGACCPPSRLGELLPQSGGCSWRHCHVHSFFPVQVCPLSKVRSHLPQVKKLGYSRAVIGFGFVSRRTGPLEVCSMCIPLMAVLAPA